MDFDKKNISGRIDIPDPVHFPYIIKESRIYDTEGELSGTLIFSGKNINFNELSANAKIDLTYKFSSNADYPINIKGDIDWSNMKLKSDKLNIKMMQTDS